MKGKNNKKVALVAFLAATMLSASAAGAIVSQDDNLSAVSVAAQTAEDANVIPAAAGVAKVGNTEYATISEAIANWTNGTTLTLLADVTLTDVIKLSSTEHHILDLGTYTMTAAKGKDAIEYVINGRSSAGYALDIKADANNPGGITATGATPTWKLENADSVEYKDENGNALVKGENGAFVEKVAEVANYDELVAALAEGGKIQLTADIAVEKAVTVLDGTVIDLNGKTLNINVENSSYGNATIKNGNIVLGKDDVHVCDGYFLVKEGKTLAVESVNVSSSQEGIKGYAVFHLKTGANLDLTNSELNIHDNEYAAGYIVYAGEPTATVDVVDTTVTASKVNGIVHAATVIENSTFTITNATEHGINRSGVTITDSTVAISGGAGRGITAQHGPLVVNGNSTINIKDMGEATIELRNDQDLTIADTATVQLDAAVNNTTSGTITGSVILPPKGNNFNGYVGTDAIWGEVWGNARESFVIKVLDANGNVMGTTSLNNIDGILDGDVNVTWSLKLDAASNTDEYWTMEWTTAPTADNIPASVELWVDGVKVSGGNVVLSGPDDIQKIYAATADENGKILAFHTNVQEAIVAAQAGDEIVLLADVAEDVTVPAGVIFNGNGKQVGVITAAGEITFKGYTKAANFGTKYTNTTINIGEGACLETTSGRLVIGYGCTFNITGTITDAKTADKANIQPSLIVAGASFTGTNLTFNVNNAYVKFNSNSTSKNSNANGTFNFNVNNSIWDQTGVLAFYVPTSGMDPTFNLTLKDSVLTTTSHLVFAVTKGEIVIDNSNVNVGTSRQLENRSTMTIKNGSVVNGAVATSSNAINPGTIIVEDATYAVTGQFSGAAEGIGTLVIKKGATVSVGSIVDKANVQIDATDMTADDEINFTGNLSKFTGEIEVVNNDKLEGKIVDGKIVLAVKPVASVNGVDYTTVAEAIAAAQNGDTVTLYAGEFAPINISNKNITIKGTVGADGELLTIIKGGNPAITAHGFNGTIKDLKVVDAFKVMYAEPAGNVTVDNIYVTGATYGIHLVACSKGLTWTIQNSYMDLAWANSFGVSGGDAAIVIKDNEFASTNPYYPDYGALPVNTFLPNVTVEGNVFGEKTKIKIDKSITDTSKINISKNYHADGVNNAFAEDSDVKTHIFEYYADEAMTNLVKRTLPGSGSTEAPYTIGSVEDWELFAKLSQSGESFSGKIITLTADIDFSGINFLEIAEDGTVINDLRIPKFSGTFDGGNYTIKNLNFKVKNTGKNRIMIFSQDHMWAYIRNLKIENITVYVADISGETRITGLANHVNAGGMTDAAIKNVHIKNFKIESNNTTSSDFRIGGFAYFVQGSQLVIKDSSITGFEVNVNKALLVGGAVSVVKSKCDFDNVDVIDAVFKINTFGDSGIIGGFAAQTQDQGTGTTFTDCDVTNVKMNIGSCPNNIGGFVGSIGSVSQFYNCTVTGSIEITDGASVGGFVGDLGWNGMFAPNVQHEFNNCVTDVDITSTNANVGGFIGNSTVAGYPGRFMPAYFNNCEAKGDVQTENGVAGGFVAHGDRGNFNGCSASGDVSGRIAGGFWGEIYPKSAEESTGGWSYQNKPVTHTDANAKTIVLEKLTVSGEVSGTEYEAGLIGFVKDVYVDGNNEVGYATPIVMEDNNTSDFNRYEYPAGSVDPLVWVAQIGDTKYETLVDAFKAATNGSVIEILADVVIDGKWDCRDYATNGSHSQFKESVTINGNGHTIKFTGTISDNNWNTIFRFEENATVNNLTIDISEATGAQRIISAKKSLTVDGLIIIGSAKYGVIFGESASAADLAAAEIVIKNSTLTGTRRAISDNEGGKDVKSIVITGNTLNANVYASASESIVFNNNTAASEVDLRSYTADTALTVEAQGNTLNTAVKNYILAKTITAQDEFAIEHPAFKVATKAELNAALAAAQKGDTIILTADIDYGTDQLKIEKAITLDLGGNTLTTRNAYGGISVKNNPTIKNGTIVHASNTAAIKVWNAVAFEDLVIDVQGKGDANKTIGGIVLQSSTTTRVDSIKNVTIKGKALTNGIETYNCGDATENVIGSMENVTINANGTGMLISALCGTATGCTISGGNNAIEIFVKGTYSASLDLVDCDVEGGIFAHDEFSDKPDIVNNGTLNFTADAATTGVDDVTLTLARAENVEGILKDIKDNAQATVNNTYYATLADAVEAAKAGETITLIRDVALKDILVIDKAITLDGNGKTLTSTAGRAINVSGANGVTIKNLTIKASGERAINVIQNATNVTIENVTATAANYTVNLAASAANAVVTIKNSNLTGLNVVNVGAAGANVTVDGTVVNCNDQSDVEKYAALCLNKDAKNTTIAATNVTFNVKGDSHKARNGAEGGEITIDGSTKEVAVVVAYIATNTDYYYDYLTLADAVEAAKAGETITLLRDVQLSEIITIDKAITIDTNNHTLRAEFVLAAADVTLTAPEGLEVTTIAGYKVVYEDGVYVAKRETKFQYVNLSVGVDLSVNFYVSGEAEIGTGVMNFSMLDLKGTEMTSSSEPTEVTINGQIMWKFTFKGVGPHLMGNKLTATLVVAGEVKKSYEYSIKDYAYEQLALTKEDLGYNDGQFEDYRKFLVNMLNYGAESQKYMDLQDAELTIPASELVTANLTEEQKKLIANYHAVEPNAEDDVKPEGVIVGKVVILGSKNKIEILLQDATGAANNATKFEGWYVKVYGNGYRGTKFNIAQSTTKGMSGFYSVMLENILVTEYDNNYDFFIYNAAGEEVGIISYSVQTYVFNTQNTTKDSAALTRALWNYYHAAEDYIDEF